VGVPVEIANPFKNVIIDSRRFDPGFIMDVAPMAAVAVGLALRPARGQAGVRRMRR
jgi:type IV pilus assembly protein PilM